MDFKYKVCTRCMTYNQKQYIQDTLRGFCMQETSFPVVYVIMDDASIDGEQEVIRQFLKKHFDLEDKLIVRNEETDDYNLTFARHKTNSNCYFVVFYLKYNHYKKKSKLPYLSEWNDKSKYIASCEGDDYWTNPRKLQQQVNFLDSHPDYSMCFHNTKILYEDTSGSKPDGVIRDGQVSPDTLFARWTVPTASIMFRKEVMNYQTKGNHRILYGDIIHILKCAEYGKVWGMKDEMSVYRVHSDSAIHNIEKVERDRFKKPQHYKFILDNFKCVNKRLVRQKIGVAYFDCFCRSLCSPFKAFFYLFLSLYYNPNNVFKFIVSYVRRRKVC